MFIPRALIAGENEFGIVYTGVSVEQTLPQKPNIVRASFPVS